MARLHVRPADVDETFVRSGGHGGQNVNKTSTCVMLLHRPSQIRVKAQTARYQAQNRLIAWRLLLDKIEAQQKRASIAERSRLEKIRRQTRTPSHAAKERNLAAKAFHSAKKENRRPVRLSND
jgi:protein subunit release factor B